MAGVRFLFSKSSRLMMYNTCLKPNIYVNEVEATVRPCFTCISRDYTTDRRSKNVDLIPPRLPNLHLRTTFPLLGTTHVLHQRLYSSSSKGIRGEDVQASGSSGPEVSDTGGFDGNDLLHKVKEAWHSSVNVASQTGEKAKEALDEVTPHVEQLLDTYPYLRDVIVPVGGTIMGTIAAWAILPRIFRRFHRYSEQGPGSLLPAGSLWAAVPYEKSFWGALEVPVRYLVTFMAFSQIGVMVAPTTIASQFIAPAWRGAFILSVVWFLHRWKTNVISRALVIKSVEGVDRDKLLTLDKFSSVGLFVLGGMALAEA
ncbi:hypothetical protein OSB04_008477 [Centaurea solstitialis]|uniref:Uncharacterized protein n=1 Tax=Centaurea solstitialis TaxID=347529 RepID=A0AA38WJI9_9ASTR|nr:hypothetical protein OSB04_008477 [Centaurea solstitialis]